MRFNWLAASVVFLAGCGGTAGIGGSSSGGTTAGGSSGTTSSGGGSTGSTTGATGSTGSTTGATTSSSSTGGGSGGLSFAAPSLTTIGKNPDGFIGNAAAKDVATGDLNGDGKPDLVVLHIGNACQGCPAPASDPTDDTVYVLINRGDGTFLPPVAYPIGKHVWNVYLGDFNGDGKLDITVPQVNQDATAVAVVLLNNGDGTFGKPIFSAQFGDSRGFDLGDFNGDGKLDMVVNNMNHGTVSVLLGNGDGTFKPRITSPAPAPAFPYSRWIAAADFNHDGKLDVAVACGVGVKNTVGNAGVTILFGKGDGTFTLGEHYLSPPSLASWGGAPPPTGPNGDVVNPEDVAALDVNSDGIPDLVVSTYDHNVDVLIGNGDGTFQPAVSYIPGEYPRSVSLADMNGDGVPDLVVGNVGCFVLPGKQVGVSGNCAASPGSVAILLGNGGGTFQAPVLLKPFEFIGWQVVADFNGDGKPDIAVTGVQDDNALAVILNQTSP